MNEALAIGIGVGVAALLVARRSDAAPTGGFDLPRYEPFAPETIELFREAARLEGFPLPWAEEPGLHRVLAAESNGWVGLPNGGLRHSEHWPQIWDRARRGDRSLWWPEGSNPEQRLDNCPSGSVNPYGTAYMGLGQLGPGDCGQGWQDGTKRSTRFLPRGAASLGHALDEARGMLGYIDDRYGDPANAWANYRPGWGY